MLDMDCLLKCGVVVGGGGGGGVLHFLGSCMDQTCMFISKGLDVARRLCVMWYILCCRFVSAHSPEVPSPIFNA